MSAAVPHNRVCLRPDDEARLAWVVRSGQIGPGPQVRALEEQFAARFRPGGDAACVSSGTAALALALDILRPMDVSVPSYACTALYHAAAATIGIPSIHDCGIDLNTPSATIVVHTYGTPCHVRDGAIEDFTHAVGGSLNGRPLGSFGAASVISFGATKPLGCGVGGAVLGPPELITEVRDRRDYDGKRDLRRRFNWQMGDLEAALALGRLERLDDEVARRREIASRYAAVCLEKGIPVTGTQCSTWYRFVIWVSDPVAAIEHFAEDEVVVINPLEPWELLHRQIGAGPDACPSAEAAAAHTVSLPIWPGMSEWDVDRVVIALERLPA